MYWLYLIDFYYFSFVFVGRWERAESYANDILDDLRHSVSGWVDWNLCLDLIGGPNWAKNFVDSPVIVDKAKQTFYKQPMYYAMGHFTKFIPRGSVCVDCFIADSFIPFKRLNMNLCKKNVGLRVHSNR